MTTIITSYYDYLLFENKGVPDFVEKTVEKLKNINYKVEDTIILKENQISKESIINIGYIDLKRFNAKSIITDFTFEDFDFDLRND